MVQHRTMLKLADNTGAKKLQVIRVLGGYKKRYARLGEIVTAAVKEAVPHGMVKKSEIVHAVLVRTAKEVKRKDGSYIRFDDNAVVVLESTGRSPKGTRVFGPVARELKEKKFDKIVSLAPEVL